MKKRIAALSICSVLSFSLLIGTQSKPAKAAPEELHYVLAYKGNLPSNFTDTISKAGGSVERIISEVGIVEVSSSNSEFLTNIKKDTSIQSAGKELQAYLEADPDDKIEFTPGTPNGEKVTLDANSNSYWDKQWDMQNLTHNGDSYNINKGSHKTVVAVIDTGIDFGHPDLKANADLAGSKTFVPGTTDAWDKNGHGTHVAGSIAANGKVKGVGPKLTVRAYRVFGATGGAEQSWITDAIVSAANDGVDVINMSIGGWRWMANNLDEKGESASMVAYHRAIQYAIKKGVTVVVSAGNDSRDFNNIHDMQDYWKTTYGLDIKGPSRVVPAQIPGVITVSSSNQWSKDSIAFYSNYGSVIDVAAPGGDNGPVYDGLYRQNPTGNFLNKRDYTYRTLSTYPTYPVGVNAANPNGTNATTQFSDGKWHGYSYLHGTSMAAPKVAGIAGVIKAAHPEYNPAQVAAAIRQSALDYGKKGQDPLYGSGEANIYSFLSKDK
ncbi:nisin leader peptide-processing serine protease NisP [Bacillus sp. FJAT-25509]|uniref:S8 family serine peptidase n=1 Tax=Bacillus sp. FJAT-25509 TaxID=1712029 RepID=UPI0006FCB039|nr:S8 family serine peptidase [Bacillus sp. FJAT-25509]KQL38174.1 nisin leader peptide-processing serine protease NisP [Bacillus sp. FJAT-25509]